MYNTNTADRKTAIADVFYALGAIVAFAAIGLLLAYRG